MSMYAFKDKDRKQKVTADEAQRQDNRIRYYCPNPNCDAHLRIVNVRGLRKPYFRAGKGNKGHSEGCDFYKNTGAHNPQKCRESEFDLAGAILNLMTPEITKKSPNIKITLNENKLKLNKDKLYIPRTIRQIYDMCKWHLPDDKINNIFVGMMLLDSRSAYMYNKGVFGSHLIEFPENTLKCDEHGYSLVFHRLCGKTDGEYTFILTFSDILLYKKVQEKLYNNRNNKIAVAGNWKRARDEIFNHFEVEICSEKQIMIVK